MAKKLTPTIATALAERVREKLKLNANEVSKALIEKGKKNKNYKEFCKLEDQIAKLQEQSSLLKKAFENEMSTPIAKVYVSGYRPGNYGISITEKDQSSVDKIKGLILLEDYVSDGKETIEQLVDRITTKLLTP